MKKINKTYHIEESVGGRGNNSPGRIVKNQNKSEKGKGSQRYHAGSTSQSRKQQFEEINRKTQQRLERNEKSKKRQKSQEMYQRDEGYVSYFGQSKHLMSIQKSDLGSREEGELNPYEQIYQNDMKYFQEYCNSMAKNEFNGINMNWPYYFNKNSQKQN